MKTLYAVINLLQKRWLANLILIIQVFISIIALALVFSSLSNLYYNLRATQEMPGGEGDYSLFTIDFHYYSTEEAAEAIEKSGDGVSVGKVYSGSTFYNKTDCNVVAYNHAIYSRYNPRLLSGTRLTAPGKEQYIPAIATHDLGLGAGDDVSLEISGHSYQVKVIGVLDKPTQYIFPTGGAGSEYATSDMFIGNESAFIIPLEALEDLEPFFIMSNLFIFSENGVDKLIKDEWDKYGEVNALRATKELFKKQIDTELKESGFLFLLFAPVAFSGILSNNIIQNIHNRKTFIVYYLCGMNWKKCFLIEFLRTLIVASLTMIGIIILGILWLVADAGFSLQDILMLYGIVFAYLFFVFFLTGAGSLIRLMREDISQPLKDLQRGE